MNGFEGISPIEGERKVESINAKKVRVANLIQIELMKKYFESLDPAGGEEAIREAEKRWVVENSEAFREAFEMMLQSDPQMLDKWVENKDQYIGIFQEHLDATARGERKAAA